MTIPNLGPQSIFNREIRRLISLYNAALYAFPEKAKSLSKEIHTGGIAGNEKIYLNNDPQPQFLMANNGFELVNKLKSGYSKTLREILIIRAVSALEVLLIDLIRETFLHKKYLFHTGQKIEFNQSELLSAKSMSNIWTKIINKECRNLQNQGIKEIVKYYKTSFSIDFGHSPVSINQIQHIHNIRHLLVHRMAKTDATFRHENNTTKLTVELTQVEFYDAISKIQEFGDYISQKILDVINQPGNPNISETFDTKCFLVVQLLSESLDKIFASDFSFLAGENVFQLKDLLESYDLSENELKLNLFGEKKTINSYLKLVRSSEKNGNVKIIHNKRHVFPIITSAEIKKVEELITEESVTNEHLNMMVEKLGIKKRKIQQIIYQINSRKEK